jgi:hypothetical protein
VWEVELATVVDTDADAPRKLNPADAVVLALLCCSVVTSVEEIRPLAVAVLLVYVSGDDP